ncbi:MAG: reverse transcriptase family protein, partial [Micropepsaceae bacterium]
IEAPKPRTKIMQRRVLGEILNHLPPHDAAYGFVAGRSCAEAAAKHAGEHVVITVDLRDFFLSTPLRRVHAVFRCLGYPHAVARALTSLCSTSTPRHISAGHFDHEGCQRHLSRHLPQGAPTSPALANLAALSLDRRLTGLANRFDARYTRYADDLTFSGDEAFHASADRFLKAVETIGRDEGYALNAAKTRVMPRHKRQTITGIVVNDHVNVPRDNFDALKATLTNCLRHGAPSQNRDAHSDFRAHLDGRIAWVERLNLRRGEKLRRLFDAVAW